MSNRAGSTESCRPAKKRGRKPLPPGVRLEAFTVRLPPSVLASIRAEAKAAGRSTNSEIGGRLQVSLAIPREAFNARVSPVTENEWLAAYKRALRSKLRRMEDRS